MNDDLLTLRLEGEHSTARAVQLVDDALKEAVQRGIPRALLDVRGLTGFPRPSVAALSESVRRWAETSQGRVKVAMLARRELIDPERFGVILARRHGLVADVFEDEAAALEWLKA